MVWGKAGSTTLSASEDVVTATVSNNKFYTALSHNFATGGNTGTEWKLNSTTSGYAQRRSPNGGSDTTLVNQSWFIQPSGWNTDDKFNVVYICNVEGEEKLAICSVNTNNGNGAGNVPDRDEIVAKSTVSTSDDITSISNNNNTSGSYTSDSNLSVLGSEVTPSATIPAIPPLVKSLQSPSVGGWVELGRTTLGSANATIDVTSLADKRYLMMLCTSTGHSGGANTGSQFNADTGNNYSRRGSNNGGSDGTDINFPDMEAGGTSTEPHFQVAYASNVAGQEKLLQSWLIAQTGAGSSTAPFRNESVGKWANTSNAVSSYQWITSASATFNSGSEVVVLGWDPADTHTTNFWEELATASGAGSTLDTGTFTAKKYLWVQCYCKPTSSSNIRLNFNSDTAGNYAIRESINGGTDTTNIQQGSSDNLTGTSTGGLFFNMFIINVAGQEKLWISHGQENTAGAGTAGDRKEMIGKWTNTSDAITKITCHSNFGATSELRVWGSD